MTREKEVKVSALNYLDDFNPDVCGICNEDIYDAFIAGTLYADRNPDLSPLWHDASEFPNKALPIIVEIDDDIEHSYEVMSIDETDEKFWKYLVGDRDITRWAYVKDLLPKGEER